MTFQWLNASSSRAEGEFIVAWKVLASTFSITEKTDGKKLSNALLKVAVADNAAIVQQVIALEGELAALETDILAREQRWRRQSIASTE